jgi:branched-chain amino acid aminotransferase
MINFNGDLLPDNAECLRADNLLFAEGYGLVEDLRVVNGTVFFWEEHYLRLMAAMRILRMEIPMNFTMEFLQEEIFKTLRESTLFNKPALISFFVFPKTSSFSAASSRPVSYLIKAKELISPFYLHENKEYEVDLYKDFYIQAGMLSTLPLAGKVLKEIGRVYARENGYADCILLNDQKNVVESLEGNLFLVTGQTVKTPPLSEGCQNGVLRKKIIDLISKSTDLTLEEKSISPFELQKADEIFIAGIAWGIQSVTRYRKAEYTPGLAHNILGKLNAMARLS